MRLALVGLAFLLSALLSACSSPALRRGEGPGARGDDGAAPTTVEVTAAENPTEAPGAPDVAAGSARGATDAPSDPAAPSAAPGRRGPTTVPGEHGSRGRVVTVRYRAERRVTDQATEGFEEIVKGTLADPRGWSRAGFHLVEVGDAPYVIVLAEGDEVDRLCLPYETYGLYSCQNGPVVALNADRWRMATPKWTGDLGTYRQMLVNHEVGHLLGQRHPRVQCPRRGRPAPVMAQQSTELDGCLPNPWPLPDEVALAARHDRTLAPGPQR